MHSGSGGAPGGKCHRAAGPVTAISTYCFMAVACFPSARRRACSCSVPAAAVPAAAVSKAGPRPSAKQPQLPDCDVKPPLQCIAFFQPVPFQTLYSLSALHHPSLLLKPRNLPRALQAISTQLLPTADLSPHKCQREATEPVWVWLQVDEHAWNTALCTRVHSD